MNTLERLAYWKTVAGDTSNRVWDNIEDDLYAFFQRFRPLGQNVEKVFEGVERGQEILARLLPFYEHTKEGAENDAYFVVREPIIVSRPDLLALVTEYLGKVNEIANASGVEELITVLSSMPIELQKGQPPSHTAQADQTYASIYDTVTDWFIDIEPVQSDALLLHEAFYSMACDYQLSQYIMWPLYQDKAPVKDPFMPYYQLWKRGAELRFSGKESLTVYAPALVP
jgi:hypothetical protein